MVDENLNSNLIEIINRKDNKTLVDSVRFNKCNENQIRNHPSGKEGIIIIDGTWRLVDLNASAAWCAYEDGFQWVGDYALSFRSINALYAKAKACYYAILWAKQHGWGSVSILTDSLLLIQNLRAHRLMDYTINH